MALYLGANKIAGNITSIIQEGEVEIPEINQEVVYLTDLADGLYKCTYETMWASPVEEEASSIYGALVTGEQQCYLYKHTPLIGGYFTGVYCQPFDVRLITTTGDEIISVGSDGLTSSNRSISAYQFENLQTKVTTLEEAVNALPSQEITFVMSGNTDITYTALRGMTWREWISSEYNTDGYYITTTGHFISSANGNFTFTYVNDEQIYPWEVISNGETYYGAK